MKSKKFLILVVFLMLMLFSSCSNVSSTDESYSGGKHIKIMCLYQDLYCKVQINEFKKSTGIKASYSQFTSYDDVINNISNYDIIYGGSSNFYYLNLQNKLYPYRSKFSKPIDNKYKDSMGRWTSVDFAPIGFCSNRQILQNVGLMPPSSWNDLLDESYRGRISYLNPYTNGIGMNTVFSIFSAYEQDSRAKTTNYLDALDKLVPEYYTYGSLIVNAVETGKLATGIVVSHDCIQSEYLSYPVTLTFPSEGTSYVLEAAGIINSGNTEQINLSKKFIDFVLDSYSQGLSQKIGTFQLPVNPVVPLSTDLKYLSDIHIVDDNSRFNIPRKHAVNFIDSLKINYNKKEM